MGRVCQAEPGYSTRHVKGAARLARAWGQMRSESSLGATSLRALEGLDSYSQ